MSAMALGMLESGVEIAVPTCEPGIGKVILTPSTSDLIADVEVKPFALWPDDRGYFLEVARLQQGLVSQFPAGLDTDIGSSKLSGHYQSVSFSQISD